MSKNAIEFMQGYAKWLEETRKELEGKMHPRKVENEYERFSFKEDGSVWRVYKTRRSGPQEYWQNWIKVTPWKESKHYVEIKREEV